MDKYIKQLEECVTFKQLLAVVQKYDNKRTLLSYLPFFLPIIIGGILLYVSVILLIVFGINKFIPQLILIFTIAFLICGFGIYDKFFAFKIFKRARQKEINAIK